MKILAKVSLHLAASATQIKTVTQEKVFSSKDTIQEILDWAEQWIDSPTLADVETEVL